MLIQYPDIKPYQTYRLKVDGLHELYLEESGNPDGIPVVFIHGGPGVGCSKQDRCFFDPDRYRIVLFDQRGCGRSTPYAELKNNTTPDLVEDLEKIRSFLGIEKWLVFGGSWGSTLGLLYAQAYPGNVLGLILRGVFLGRKQDIAWFFQEGASRIFPDYWEDFLHPIPEAERHDLVAAYYNKLTTGSNELAKMAAAKAWALWEARCGTLRPSHCHVEELSDPHTAVSMARIATHFFTHQAFLEPNQILSHVNALEGIPGIIVHGRYDLICALDNAFTLHRQWHQSELHIIRDAGHASREPSIIDALIRATRAMAKRFEGDYPVRA